MPEAEERISYNMPSFYQNGTVRKIVEFRLRENLAKTKGP
ncbi:hypothetical protein SPIRO4BDMA_50661 [uncultured spirochete]|uniref:Uncharacterized protein n=1 Tax=uncultured spirochete TaxID=156406 RepID=A0A3P3XS64_9SPIR|nr:hypothetical protein SPIRO4BDMA_50661 [uncultured spirochete]